MLKSILVTEMHDEKGGWRLSFNGLISQTESIEIDEETAREILKLQKKNYPQLNKPE
jgi:hypothetical protein